jgi:hypothetical protein
VAIEDDAEGVEGVVGGELVTGGEDGVENLLFGHGFAFDDLEDSFFKGEFVARTRAGRPRAVIAFASFEVHRTKCFVNGAQPGEQVFAFCQDGVANNGLLLEGVSGTH